MAKRTSLAVLSVLMFALLALGFPLLRSIENTDSERLARSLDQDSWLLATALPSAVMQKNVTEIKRLVAVVMRNQDMSAMVLTADGTVLVDTRGATEKKKPQNAERMTGLSLALSGRAAPGVLVKSTGRVVAAVPIANQGGVVGALSLAFLDHEVQKRARTRRLTLSIVGLTGAALALLFSIALSRWITRPVRRLQLAARTFATGELKPSDDDDQRSSRGPREVKDLAETMEAMAKQLDLTLVSHRSFLANASHQLRSPLTAIALRLDNLRDRIGEDPERDEKDLSIMHSSIYDLSIQLDQLVRLAKTDHDSLEERVAIDASGLLSERKTLWEEQAKMRGITLTLDIPETVHIFATPGRIAQAVDNLITNAIDASPSGTTIQLAARVKRTVVRHESHKQTGRVAIAELRVIDHGAGMSEEKRQRAFQLYATDKPSDRGLLGGSGLGLSLVQLLVLADRGAVTLEETPGGGTTAVITLPQAVVSSR